MNNFENRVRQTAGMVEAKAANAPMGTRFEETVTGRTETATITATAVDGWPTVHIRFSDGTIVTVGGPVGTE